MTRAEEEVRAWLEETARLSVEGDFDAYARRMRLPLRLSTRTGVTILHGERELRQVFDDWNDMLASIGVDRTTRQVAEVRPVGPNLMSCRYVTEFWRGDARHGEPYPGAGLLRYVEGEWRAEEIWVGVENRSFPLTEPRANDISDDGDVFRRFAKETKK